MVVTVFRRGLNRLPSPRRRFVFICRSAIAANYRREIINLLSLCTFYLVSNLHGLEFIDIKSLCNAGVKLYG